MAEYFWDVKEQDVPLFIGNIFHFAQNSVIILLITIRLLFSSYSKIPRLYEENFL